MDDGANFKTEPFPACGLRISEVEMELPRGVEKEIRLFFYSPRTKGVLAFSYNRFLLWQVNWVPL